MKINVFWDIERVVCYQLIDVSDVFAAVFMEAPSISETSADFYQATRYNSLLV